METDTLVFGFKIQTLILILFVLIVVLAVALIITYIQLQKMSRKYYTLTSGKQAKDLEHIMLTRFREMDKIKARMKRFNKEHKTFKGHLDSCYNKLGLVKYDAFDNMAGELSYSLALLNANNSGFVITSMHSKEGCFSYAKEVFNGEAFIALSNEEKEAIKKAQTIDEEIQKMVDESTDSDDIM